MPTVYIFLNSSSGCYQIRCKDNRELNSWFDALEYKKELQFFSVCEKEQIISSFLKIKSLKTVPFLSLAGAHSISVVRKDTTIFLDLSARPFSSNNKLLNFYDNVHIHILTINFINNDKNN